MSYDPDFDFGEDLDDMSPAEVHDAWEGATNLDAGELRDAKQSERNDVYLERASGNQEANPPIEGGPLEDAIHLAETPASEWGPDEKTEAIEAINFGRRTVPQFDQDEGEALLPDESPRVHKGEMALIRWAFDPAPDDGFP